MKGDTMQEIEERTRCEQTSELITTASIAAATTDQPNSIQKEQCQ